MRVTKVAMTLVLLVSGLAGMLWGQSNDKPKVPPPDNPSATYRLEYVIAEVEDGKRVNTRSYSIITDEGGMGNMHLGMRVPLQGEKGPIYMDVGLRIDARVRSREGGDIWLSTRFELSSLVDQAQGISGALPLRTVEYSTAAVVTPGKSGTVIALGDDLSSKKKFELSVTVTKLK